MKIVWVTDMKPSGYRNLSVPICERLAEDGHEIKIAGLGYKGEEHFFPFSIIPCEGYNEIYAISENLEKLWNFDILIVALDIPMQEKIMRFIKERSYLFWGIFPIESLPLSRQFVEILNKMDKCFVLSKFGTKEALSKGVDAVYLPFAIDSNSWRIPSEDEREMMRGSYGLSDDEFTILTVADNQERKFLSRAAQIIRDFKISYGVPLRWILVTREHLDVGWNINSLLSDMGILNETLVIERGIPFKELWMLYSMSDCFLLTSKAEGLGIPVLEAMACGLPVAATNCTGMKESMERGGGFPIEPEELEDDHIDPFGNSFRYFASIKNGVRQLKNIHEKQGTESAIRKARGFVETLTWDRSARIIKLELEKL